MSQLHFFFVDKRDDRLEKLGCRLNILQSLIPWEIFRKKLERLYKVSPNGGRPPYDCVMMLKILVLQSLYNLSDDEMEYQVTDRLSFQKFLGIEPEDSVPDAKTIWVFRERLKKEGIYDSLFREFNKHLEKHGYKARGGQMIDATFQEVPTQRNTREENEKIKKTGTAPEEWSEAKKAQKDTDARWTKKRDRSYFGYKNHVKERNRAKSRIRCRVEHVFGLMSKLARESRRIFTKGRLRAEVKISLKNLAYNICRYVTLCRIAGKLRTC